MKSFFFSFSFLLLAIFLPFINCLVHNDVIKFGEENSIRCPVGKLYILHCEIKCMNSKNKILYKNCLEDLEKKCSGSKCTYYFDYKNKKNTQSFRNKNSIEVSECVNADVNEVKTSTTCLESSGSTFHLSELNTQYFFFIKNKNSDPFVCTNGIINVKGATLYSPFCEVKLKDISNFIRKHCDGKKECIVNTQDLPKSLLNSDDHCYKNNSYIYLNVACNKDVADEEEEEEEEEGEEEEEEEEEEMEEENKDSSDDSVNSKNKKQNEKSEEGEENNDIVIAASEDEIESDSTNEKEENEKMKDKVLSYINNKEIMKEHVNIKNDLLKRKEKILNKIGSNFSQKTLLFKKLAERISKNLGQKYRAYEIQDLLEDKYNELRRNADYSLYYDSLLELFKVKDMEKSKLDKFKINLLKDLKYYLGRIGKIEKVIGENRKNYIAVYNESKQFMFKIFDENSDDILDYDNFPHDNGMISSEIFFKYHPDISLDSLKNMNEKGKLNEDEIKELNDIDDLGTEEKKNRIKEMKKNILLKLKALYSEKNEIFNTQAHCIKAYCYKNPLNLKYFRTFLKDIYSLSKENSDNILLNVVRYLNDAGNKKTRWSDRRKLNKLNFLIFQGFKLLKEKEIEIDKEIERFNILYLKARSNNFQGLFSKKDDNLLKKVADYNKFNEVVGSQANTFEFIDKIDETTYEGNKGKSEDTKKADNTTEEEGIEEKGEINKEEEENNVKTGEEGIEEKGETDKEEKENNAKTDEEGIEEKGETDKEEKEDKQETDEEETGDETDEDEDEDETNEDETDEDETDEDETNEDETNEDKINEDKINEDKINEDKINEDETNEDKIKEDETNEDKIKEDETNEDKIKEDETNEDKINEDKIDEDKINEDKINEDETNEDKTDEDKINEDKINEDETDEDETDEDETNEDKIDEDKIDQDETNEDKIDEDKIDQDETNEDKIDQDETNEDETNEDKIDEDKINEDETNEDETNEDKTNEDKTNEDEIGEDETVDEILKEEDKELLDNESNEDDDLPLNYTNELHDDAYEQQEENEKNEKEDGTSDNDAIKDQYDENIEDSIKNIKEEDASDENIEVSGQDDENIDENTNEELGEYVVEDLKDDNGSSFFLNISNSILIILVILFIEMF